MPVLLLDREARETWLNGSVEDALALQGPATGWFAKDCGDWK